MNRTMVWMLCAGLVAPAGLTAALLPAAVPATNDSAESLLGLAGADGVTLAKAAGRAQVAMLGVAWHDAPPLPAVAPSAAALAVFAALGLAPSPLQARQAAALDALPPAVAQSLGEALAAWLAHDAAARAAVAAGPSPSDWAGVLAARDAMLDAGLALHRAVAGARLALPPTVDLSPAMFLDFAGSDTTYTVDLAFAYDHDGNDVYRNNAGGTGACLRVACGARSAALWDFGGNDAYVGARGQGANGGGFAGAGFLYDAEGDDLYVAHDDGTNGGGFLGAGFLLDAAGNDLYLAWGWGVNGGGYPGGVGMLLDLGGDDRYEGSHSAVNGGATGGAGFLYDAAGDDTYLATSDGVNGGAMLGHGFLLDAGGDDRYEAEDSGVNGGAFGGRGLLRDAGGRDTYLDREGGSGVDVTVVPKGPLGAQLDDA